MLFDRQIPESKLLPLDDRQRREIVERLIAAFGGAFALVRYDVYWESRTPNGQAFVWEGQRRVRLYGGLARHGAVSDAGIAWALAHETGHHLGGRPLHDLSPELSSEERADAWAAQGLVEVFGEDQGRRYADVGRGEISRFLIDPSNF